MIKIALTNLGKYNEGELVYKWLELPATDDEIKETLEAIGINEEYEEYFISDYETDIDGLKVGEYDSLDRLNEYAEEWDNLGAYEQDIISAIMEHDTFYSFEKALEVYQNGDYAFYPGVSDERELGEYVVDEGLFGEVPENLLSYLDYEAIGSDWRINEGGSFETSGYIAVF